MRDAERERVWPGAALGQPAWITAGALAVLAIAYAPFLPELWRAWRTDEYAGHGMFVPVYSAFLLWMDRERLAAVPRRSEPAGALVLLLAEPPGESFDLASAAVGQAAAPVEAAHDLIAVAVSFAVTGDHQLCWKRHVDGPIIRIW